MLCNNLMLDFVHTTNRIAVYYRMCHNHFSPTALFICDFCWLYLKLVIGDTVAVIGQMALKSLMKRCGSTLFQQILIKGAPDLMGLIYNRL